MNHNQIDSFNNAVSTSLLTRALANIFVFLGLIAALTVAVYEVIAGQTVNPVVISVLSTGLGYAIHLLGLNQGVTLGPMSPPGEAPNAQSSGTETAQGSPS